MIESDGLFVKQDLNEMPNQHLCRVTKEAPGFYFSKVHAIHYVNSWKWRDSFWLGLLVGIKKNKSPKQILEAEYGSLPSLSGSLHVAVAYPNSYHVAMSNLAFQWLYQELNAVNDIRAERIFLPIGQQAEAIANRGEILRTMEANIPARRLLAWFVTLPFENDYPNLVRMLRMSHIEPLAKDRDHNAPIIIAGGTGPLLNPEPIAPIVDVIILGEGQKALKPVLSRLQKQPNHSDFLESLKYLPFAYVPKYYQVKYDKKGHRTSIKPTDGFPRRLKIVREKSIHKAGTFSRVLTPNTEFPDNLLIEIFRGCHARCRFCAAGHISLPPRERAFEKDLLPDFGQKAIGLVGAGVSAHSQISEWVKSGKKHERIGISSLRMNTLSDENLKWLADRGAKSLAIAPEAGSEQLRKVCNKPFLDEDIISQARTVIESGFLNLKLYFMVGLPTESSKDIQSIADLTLSIKAAVLPIWKSRKKAGNISVSINPFIPKANTPFQWAPFITKNQYDKEQRDIRNGLKKSGNISVRFESYRAARVQALLSLGGREAADLVLLLESEPNENAALRKWGIDPDPIIHREKTFNQTLPWDFVDSGIRKAYLRREYQQALKKKISPECAPGACRLCGLCE